VARLPRELLRLLSYAIGTAETSYSFLEILFEILLPTAALEPSEVVRLELAKDCWLTVAIVGRTF
jgi:hypothetical protein